MSDDPHLTPAEVSARAGAANLAEWKKNNPGKSNYKHGAYSKHTRKRYSDLRTREGRQLRAVITGLAEDFGGMSSLTAGQLLLLDRIKEKLVVLSQIGAFVDRLSGIITRDGGIVPALGKNYTSFAEGLRRDLQAFYEMGDRKPSRVPDLKEYLEQRRREKAEGGNGPERAEDGLRAEMIEPEGKDEAQAEGEQEIEGG